jgi:hypothetical protein
MQNKKIAIYIICAILSIYFIFTSGFVFFVIGSPTDKIDTPYSLSLSREDSIVGYYTDNDIKCAKWLAENHGDTLIYADYNGGALLMGYFDWQNTITVFKPPCYILLTEWNIDNHKMVDGTTPGLRKYSEFPNLVNAVEVFKSGKAIVYLTYLSTSAATNITKTNMQSLMFFNGGGDNSGRNYSVGVAIAGENGEFIKYAGNPIIKSGGYKFDSYQAKDPWVIQIGEQYVMYFKGATSGWVDTIHYAVSDDGINWEIPLKEKAILSGTSGTFDSKGCSFPRVIDTGITGTKRYRMIYTGRNSFGKYQTGYAYSTDGFSWTKGANNPVIAVGDDGSWDDNAAAITSNPVLYGGTYYMLYGGEDGSRYPQEHWQIGLVTFTDFEGTYTKCISNPVMSNDSGANQVLTAKLNSGTKEVHIADTSLFSVGQPVWVTTSKANHDQFTRVYSIDSPTKLTLVDNADATYTTSSRIVGWDSGSIVPATLCFNGTNWINHYTAFQPYSATVIREVSALATSSDLRSWIIDYADSPPIPYTYNNGKWDDQSSENPCVVKIKEIE